MGYSLGPSVECPWILRGKSNVSLCFFFSMLFFRSFYIYRYCFIHLSFAIYFHSILFGLKEKNKNFLCFMIFYECDWFLVKVRPENNISFIEWLELAVELSWTIRMMLCTWSLEVVVAFREILVRRLYLSILLLTFRLFADVRGKSLFSLVLKSVRERARNVTIACQAV